MKSLNRFKNQIQCRVLSKSQSWLLKNKILGLITVRTVKAKGEKKNISHKLWTPEKGENRVKCYNPVILAGIISGWPGFLSSHAAQTIIVRKAMEHHC